MKSFDDSDLREFLLNYDVCEPCPELVVLTKRLMHEELLQPAAKPVRLEKWVLLIVGLSVVMSLCLFYIFTIETILRFTLPLYMQVFINHTLYAFTAAGGSLIAGAIMVLYFKQFHIRVSYFFKFSSAL